jgi:hypothetical protein
MAAMPWRRSHGSSRRAGAFQPWLSYDLIINWQDLTEVMVDVPKYIEASIVHENSTA